jgi:hypothetical protein
VSPVGYANLINFYQAPSIILANIRDHYSIFLAKNFFAIKSTRRGIFKLP